MPSERKTAIVTGASSGIGRVTAIALVHAGWNVVLAARRADALQESADLCNNGEQCLSVTGDVADEDFVQELFAKTTERFGRLDMLFNNAGIAAPAVPIDNLSLTDFKSVIDINVTGLFLCTREAMRVFKRQLPPGGRVINNGSLSAHTTRPYASAYTCSKHAVTGLTKSTALEGREFGITCTQIDIGNAATVMAVQRNSLQPNGTVMVEDCFDPQHVADMIVHIANLPIDVQVLDMKIMAARVPFVGRG